MSRPRTPRATSDVIVQKSECLLELGGVQSAHDEVVSECHRGYPRLAAFQASGESFLLYRRFGYLQARVLLDKQDQLRILEEEVKDLDDEMKEFGRPTDLQTRNHISDDGLSDRRADLMRRIEETYCSYCQCVTSCYV